MWFNSFFRWLFPNKVERHRNNIEKAMGLISKDQIPVEQRTLSFLREVVKGLSRDDIDFDVLRSYNLTMHLTPSEIDKELDCLIPHTIEPDDTLYLVDFNYTQYNVQLDDWLTEEGEYIQLLDFLLMIDDKVATLIENLDFAQDAQNSHEYRRALSFCYGLISDLIEIYSAIIKSVK